MITQHSETYLEHHGILGQKWGVRRYQNPDGTLTAEGKAKLSNYKNREIKGLDSKYNKDVRSGYFGYKVERQGYKSLEKEKQKLENKKDNAIVKSDSEKIKSINDSLKINAGKVKALDSLKKLETKSIKSMTYDEMHKEKVDLGKAVAKDILTTAAVTGALLPTTGFVYVHTRDYGAMQTNERIKRLNNSK